MMHSKWMILAAVLSSLFSTAAIGQVELRLEIEPSTVLLHEPLVARVTVQNNGVRPLVINRSDGSGVRLLFIVERDNGSLAPRREKASFREMIVPAGKGKILKADLTMHFDLTRSDRYFVRALLADGDEAARSTLKEVDVVPGMELLRITGAVPDAPGLRRTYSLRYWMRDKMEQVFLCVSDADSDHFFAPVHLGTLIRIAAPSIELGKDGLVTVKHQADGSQLIVSTLQSRRDKLALVSQKLLPIAAAVRHKPPTLPRK